MLQEKCYITITDLTISLVLTTFWTDSTSFTVPFLAGRHTQAGREAKGFPMSSI